MAQETHGSPTDLARSERANWVLRWDTRSEDAPKPPRLRPWPAGSVARLPNGGWAAFEGHLFDRPDLAAALDLPRDADEATLAGAAFARWGPAALDRLRGSWLLAVFDPATSVLHVARDPMGLHPVQYVWDGSRLLVASALEALLGEPGVSRRPRRTALAELLLLRFPACQVRETFLADILRVPAAHRLEVRKGRLDLLRWWEPLPEGFEWASEAEVASFGDVFGRAVERALEAGADCIALSGGFDSVGIAAVAAERRGERPPLRAVSLRFPGESFDEAKTQVAVADALGMPQTMVTLGEGFEQRNLLDAALDYGYFSPAPVLGVWNSLYTLLFRAAHDEGSRRMIFGTGGDEMLVVDFAHALDCFRDGHPVRLWKFLRAAQRTSPFSALHISKLVLWNATAVPFARGIASGVLGRLAPDWLRGHRRRRFHQEVFDWIAKSDRDFIDELESRYSSTPRPGRGSDAEYVRRMRHLVQAPLLHMEFDQAFAWGRHLGLAALYPFLDRDLAALSLRIHPQDLIAIGRAKSPLRKLVKQLLPNVTMPVKKVDFTGLFRSLMTRHGPGAWNRLGGATLLTQEGVVSPSHLDAMLARYWSGVGGEPLRPWLVMSTETWLRDLAAYRPSAPLGNPE